MAPEAHYSIPRGTERVIVLYDYVAQGAQVGAVNGGPNQTVLFPYRSWS